MRCAARFVALASILPLLTSAGTGSLSLDAHEIGTRDGFQSFWEADWGSYDRDYARGKRILVTVRDFSRKIPTCDVTVYFIAHPVFDPNRRFIYARKEFPVHFRGRIEVTGPVDAPDLHARIVNLPLLNTRYGKGAEMEGWIVVGESDGQVFDVRASGPTLLGIARASSGQHGSLGELNRAYDDLLDNGKH